MIPEKPHAKKPIVIALVGPTASGKTSLGVYLAEKFQGEIISADARQIYQEMLIGTNRPEAAECKNIPHFGFDLVSPHTRYSAFEFQTFARHTISEISSRQRIPFLVGGTGLYIQATLYNYRFGTLGRTFEKSEDFHSLILGIDVDRDTLYQRINDRVTGMIERGLEDEVRGLVKKYGWTAPALSGIGYRQWKPFFEGTKTREEVIREIQQATRHYAKRQLTWFRGDKNIQWVQNKNDAVRVIESFLLHATD